MMKMYTNSENREDCLVPEWYSDVRLSGPLLFGGIYPPPP